MPDRSWKIGDSIHGYANGEFGRDSYACRSVEAVGEDWLVTRNAGGEAEFISVHDANQIENPADPTFCVPYDARADEAPRCRHGYDFNLPADDVNTFPA